jgi:2-hydroxychromene-2-carboxylate isomerase
MTMYKALRSGTLTLAGVGVVAAGAFLASSASAAADETAEHTKNFKRIAHFQSEGKAWQSVLNPKHVERVAEKLRMSTDELQALLETEGGREDVHAQMKDIHDANKADRLAEMAEALGMSVEEITALRSSEEGREELHASMKEIFTANKGVRQAELAEQLGMTIEDLQAAKDDPALRESIREQMQELGIERPERSGHPKNFGQFRSHMAR